MIAVIDYKAGNLASVTKALRAVAEDVVLTEDPDALQRADKIVLPGVGHFSATQRLDESGMTAAIREAIAQGKPFLGICVGMQWLLEGSEEAPGQPGLGYFQGTCRRFPPSSELSYKVPHVGWNSLLTGTHAASSKLLQGFDDESMVYFTHSYFVPADTTFRAPTTLRDGANSVAAVTNYIQPFASAIEHGNVMGVQFHPEKSGPAGLKLLENFCKL